MNLVDKNEIDIHKKLLCKTEQNLIIVLYECPPSPPPNKCCNISEEREVTVG